MSDFFFSEDITYCMDGECLRTECIRHRSKAPIGVPLSWANMKYQEECLLKKIKALPSAEEMAFNEWCTDCKEYDHEKGCCPRFNRVIRETVEEVKEAHEEMRGRWIPVSERLPKEDTDVLISYRYKEGEGDTSHVYIGITSYGDMYFGGRKVKGAKHWRQPFEYFTSNYDVMAWMPLPKPWKGEER